MAFAANSYSLRLKSVVILTFDICYISALDTAEKRVICVLYTIFSVSCDTGKVSASRIRKQTSEPGSSAFNNGYFYYLFYTLQIRVDILKTFGI